MKTQLTITDLTRMHGNTVCIAGYTPTRECVRPIFGLGRHITEGWLCRGSDVIVRPFAVVEFDLQQKKPQPPHTEDQIMSPAWRAQKARLQPGQQQTLLTAIEDPSVAGIFGATIHHDQGWYLLRGEGKRSLGTVRPVCPEIFHAGRANGGWDYRVGFGDASGAFYRLAVTDLAFRYYLDHLRLAEQLSAPAAAAALGERLRNAEVFLRIGLARGWEMHPDRCYLQITGVYSFPDYLGGRCFLDLAPRPD